MKASRADAQLNLPPSLLTNSDAAPESGAHGNVAPVSFDAAPISGATRPRSASLLTNREQLTIDEADVLSSHLVNEALTQSGISNAEAAFALGLKDESLIRKMRSPHNRERMSHGQMLVLASKHPRFYIELNAALDARTGWFR